MFLFRVTNITMFFITLSNVYCLPLNTRSVVKTLYLSPKYLDPILSKCIPMLKLKCLVAEENLSEKKCTNNFAQYCPLNFKKKLSPCKVPPSIYYDIT